MKKTFFLLSLFLLACAPCFAGEPLTSFLDRDLERTRGPHRAYRLDKDGLSVNLIINAIATDIPGDAGIPEGAVSSGDIVHGPGDTGGTTPDRTVDFHLATPGPWYPGQPLAFTADHNGGTPSSCLWTATGPSTTTATGCQGTTFSLPSPGTWDVTLSASYPDGSEASRTRPGLPIDIPDHSLDFALVTDGPWTTRDPDLLFRPTTGPGTVSCVWNITGDGPSRRFFGCGDTVIPFNDPGTFAITLSALYDDGQYAARTRGGLPVGLYDHKPDFAMTTEKPWTRGRPLRFETRFPDDDPATSCVWDATGPVNLRFSGCGPLDMAFPTEGTYSITLTATYPEGRTETKTRPGLAITVPERSADFALLTPGPWTTMNPDLVFRPDTGDDAAACTWDVTGPGPAKRLFGCGDTTISFTQAGTWSITLSVRYEDDTYATKTRGGLTIALYDHKPDFAMTTPQPWTVGKPLRFVPSFPDEDIPDSCVWDADGPTGLRLFGCDPLDISFPTAGTYDITLTGTYRDGQVVSKKRPGLPIQ